jgi:hypothetical protein
MKQNCFFTAVLAVTVLTGVSCASTGFSVKNSLSIPDGFLGISPDRSPLKEEDYRLLDELGAVWIRRTIRWTDVEPVEGQWNFSFWDSYVENGKAAGKKLLLTLGFDNTWPYKEGKERRDITAEYLPLFLRYVEKVVSRYRGKVDAYEIWNEPNWIFWKGKDETFFELTRAAAKRIKETDPGAVVLGGALWRVPKSFARGLFKAGAMEYTDAVSFHPYAASPKGAIKLYDRLAGIASEYNYPGGIWITEVGYPTGGWYPTRVSEKKFPAYIIKTLAGLAVRGAPAAMWYELMDEYNQGEAPSRFDSENFFGIIYPDKTPKTGAAAYTLCGRYLSGAEYRPQVPVRAGLSKSTESLYFRRPDGTNVLILWHEGVFPKKVTLTLSLAGTSYDIAAGTGTPIPAESVLALNRTPLFITWPGPAAAKLERR